MEFDQYFTQAIVPSPLFLYSPVKATIQQKNFEQCEAS